MSNEPRSSLLWPLALVLVALSVIAMEGALVTHDFSIQYVAENNALETPLFFTVISLWVHPDITRAVIEHGDRSFRPIAPFPTRPERSDMRSRSLVYRSVAAKLTGQMQLLSIGSECVGRGEFAQ